MADELQESDIFFSESISTEDHSDPDSDSDSQEPRTDHMSKRENNMIKIRNSAPVNITGSMSWIQYGDRDSFDDFDYDDGEMVPPHIIIHRRVAGKMAFSVCSGNGRTLKGRDLSQVRNSILKMTGFLES